MIRRRTKFHIVVLTFPRDKFSGIFFVFKLLRHEAVRVLREGDKFPNRVQISWNMSLRDIPFGRTYFL